MQSQAVRPLIPLLVCGVALFAADVWKTKDPSAWTSEDIQKVLTDSPWAKTVAVKREGFSQGGGMGRGGGGGGGGTWGGGGMGGGMGMPRIGGLGMPGGGMGGGRRGGGRRPMESLNVIVRWASAAPIKQALLKSEGPSGDKDAEKTPDAAAKSYMISVIGLPTGMRSSSSGDDNETNGDEPRRRERDPDAVREELMESTHLTPKGKRALLPSDVKFDIQGGRHEILFFFPRETEIGKNDKEVTFETQLNRMKLEKKFNLKDMTFQGKLAL